ncbi:MAG: ABC transporter permease [Oscillospiraceae bacterium]
MNQIVTFLAHAVYMGTPLLFGTLGEILNEKSGHLNLGVEGMMAMGACAGFMFGYSTNNLAIALIAAFLAGVLSSLIYAFLTITMRANQNVTGLTLTIFGLGLSNFIGEYMLSKSKTNSLKLPAGITGQLKDIKIPLLGDIPVIGDIIFNQSIFTYLGIIIAIVMFFYLNKTKKGLNLRTIGENPAVADAAGINVSRYKYIHVLIGGGICGIGGAYCSMIICGGVWMANSVNGLGWISVALVIFALWSPLKAMLGAFVFGALSVIKYYVPKIGPLAIPNAFYDMLPFIITALVLVITSVRQSKSKSMPASCGINYFREER